MDLDKIFKYKEELKENLSIEEINKLYKELMYDEYQKFTMEEYDKIHCYQVLHSTIGIFDQMLKGNKFQEGYLKDTIKW